MYDFEQKLKILSTYLSTIDQIWIFIEFGQHNDYNIIEVDTYETNKKRRLPFTA